MPASFLFALAAAAAAPAADLPALEKDPTAMSQSEIRAFNKGRTLSDPDFIRCRKSEDTGSLVRRTFTCHTMSQWAAMERQGNQNARDALEAMASKSINQSN
ncbi:MAG: hypothetical protein K2X68_01875 [Novosphingobium sp.]|nr:hypothetical protein [Novosphingobium sp.]